MEYTKDDQPAVVGLAGWPRGGLMDEVWYERLGLVIELHLEVVPDGEVAEECGLVAG